MESARRPVRELVSETVALNVMQGVRCIATMDVQTRAWKPVRITATEGVMIRVVENVRQAVVHNVI